MLKPIFNKQQDTISAQAGRTESPVQKATTEKRTQTPDTTPYNPQREIVATAPPRNAETVVAPVQHGRPAALQTARENSGSLGGIFRRSRSSMNDAGSSETPKAQGAAVTNHIAQAPQPVIGKKKVVTNELLAQAWTSFALQLPEIERALADRMKIMYPTMNGEEQFTISVDNQMAAELFDKEAQRICKGMSAFLDGVTLNMNVKVNEIVVEKHVSDRGKQYEILKEKNPLIEKLRKGLSLELSR